MNTIHRAQWGIFGKLAYRLFLRKMLKRVVIATDNPLGDDVIKVLDSVAGYR